MRYLKIDTNFKKGIIREALEKRLRSLEYKEEKIRKEARELNYNGDENLRIRSKNNYKEKMIVCDLIDDLCCIEPEGEYK
tara:strand:+ start:238 stop:477 length:240 start_codon:yes stop_codon:yes gene_type:complete